MDSLRALVADMKAQRIGYFAALERLEAALADPGTLTSVLGIPDADTKETDR